MKSDKKYGNVDDFENQILQLEEKVFDIDIIESFAHRGWALYGMCRALYTPWVYPRIPPGEQ